MKNANIALAAVAAMGIVVGLGRAAEVAAPAEPMSVWFERPAKSFHESCPLGNGRLGAMDFGGVGSQRIVLNESSLWSGGPYDGNKYDAYKCLSEARGITTGGFSLDLLRYLSAPRRQSLVFSSPYCQRAGLSDGRPCL